ncbi:tripeptidyl-peptidase 1 [Pseudomassariella vexata]|uniref:tripeptidyl-peptidase II n=1 Tax=Pseudomassariella vexata TaxID=1141098 RepID=A0A1Y2D8R1_9PEZI|nr:tripeptidyl-peptidase 1 [Pseudomassariella vexata]ORY55648.1 tripeptidyl-peptidase 1 [Pseudomassariella vexata]
MRRTTTFTLFTGAILLLLLCAEAKNLIIESLPRTPDGWIKLRDADPRQVVTLRVHFEQLTESVARFHQTLYDVSDPQHALYGRHLSREQVSDLMKPRQESVATVVDWLSSSGVSVMKQTDDWVAFRTNIETATKLLDAQFSIYSHVSTDVERVRTLRYSVPEALKHHVTMIQPTTLFGRIKPQIQHGRILDWEEFKQKLPVAATVPNGTLNVTLCNTTITPACLRSLYNVQDRIADPTVPAILGISGFLDGFAKHDALIQFNAKFAPYAAAQDFTTVLVNGGRDNQTDVETDIEANLDMQYGASMGFNTSIRYYSVGGLGPLVPDLSQPDPNEISNEPYLELATYLLALPDPELPRTLSISYGDNEQSLPRAYAQKVCNMFGMLGARGVSVIASSGDEGPGSPCQINDGTNATRFTPLFPATCPFVTTVGGTVGVQPESATAFSGGGFSEVFPRPAYQDVAVSAYLDGIGNTFTGLYNRLGRGIPDVAAQASNYLVVSHENILSVSGTSAATPTFAGMVHLLSTARIKSGMPPMGFLNPWLYSTAAAGGGMTDIVAGRTTGCTGRDVFTNLTTPFVAGAGWNATAGWDPATGMGTPLFDQLLKMAVPGAAISRKGGMVPLRWG